MRRIANIRRCLYCFSEVLEKAHIQILRHLLAFSYNPEQLRLVRLLPKLILPQIGILADCTQLPPKIDLPTIDPGVPFGQSALPRVFSKGRYDSRPLPDS